MLAAAALIFSLQEAAQASTDPLPLTQPSTWIGPKDNPNRIQGRTVAVLQVDAHGQITSCRIERSSGSDMLDQTVCQRARERARFSPARDAQGAAIAGSYILPIRWGRPSIDVEPSTSRLVLTLKDGQAISCATYSGDGSLIGTPSTSCHTPTGLLTRYYGDAYKKADRLTIDVILIAGDGIVPRGATDGQRMTLKESVVKIGDDGNPKSCVSRAHVSKQSVSFNDCVGYEIGLPFVGLKSFVSAIDWTIHFPSP